MTWTLILAVLAVSSPVRAEVPCADVNFSLPEYIAWNDPFPDEDGVHQQKGIVFDLEGTKSLLLKLNCGQYHLDVRTALEGELANEQLKSATLQERFELSQEVLGLYEVENERLYKLWEVENKKRHEAENSSSYGWVGWAAAAVLATSTLALGAVVVLK